MLYSLNKGTGEDAFVDSLGFHFIYPLRGKDSLNRSKFSRGRSQA